MNLQTIKNGDLPAASTKGQLNREAKEVYDYQIGNNDEFQFTGLTKREHFAAMAMQGLMSSGHMTNAVKIIETSVRAADALLEELEK